MASFDPVTGSGQEVDFKYLQNGPVTLFWQSAVFVGAIEDLINHGYVVIRMDASEWRCENDLHRSFADSLKFPSYFGQNFDALKDCLGDVATFEYGSSMSSTGTIVAIDNFDDFHTIEERSCSVLLDILVKSSYLALLFGHRFVVFLRSDDPCLEIGPSLLAPPVSWNADERRLSQRGL